MSSVYSLEITQADGKKELKFGGDLVINHIDKMAAEVRDALPEPADVAVTIADPSNIDMTFIQLVIAIRHQTQAAGKKFELHTTLKDDLKELAQKAGLEKDLNF